MYNVQDIQGHFMQRYDHINKLKFHHNKKLIYSKTGCGSNCQIA